MGMDVERVDGKLDFRSVGYLYGRSPQFGGPRGVQDPALTVEGAALLVFRRTSALERRQSNQGGKVMVGVL